MSQRIEAWQQAIVDKRTLPFTQLLINHHGKDIFYHQTGFKHVAKREPIARDTISRIYSMTKPISSVALMILYEEGKFQLSDPVHLYLGDKWHKSNMKVYKDSEPDERTEKSYTTKACETSVTIKHVLTHTSGLVYGGDPTGMIHPVDGIYHLEGVCRADNGFFELNGHFDTLKDFVDALASMPLLFQPGSKFNYGYNVEVVGRLVEVISGKPFDQFVEEKILVPLQMVSTHFYATDEDWKSGKVSELYGHPPLASMRGLKVEDLRLKHLKDTGRQWTKRQTFF